MDATTVATYSQMQSIIMHHQEVEPLSSDHVRVMVYMQFLLILIWPQCICVISVHPCLALVRYYTHMHEHLLIHLTGRHLATPQPTCEPLYNTYSDLKLEKEQTTLHTTHGN